MSQGAATGTTPFTNGTTFTAPANGFYRVNAQVRFDVNSGNWTVNDILGIFINKEGSVYEQSTVYAGNTGTGNVSLAIDDIVQLNAGERLQISGVSYTSNKKTRNGGENKFVVERIGGIG